MERIKIGATPKTPEVLLDADKGILIITGRSIAENPEEFYKEVFEGIERYFEETDSLLEVEVHFEYFNTASAKKIMDLFKTLEGHPSKVYWVFEEGDLDMEEAGMDYQSLFPQLLIELKEKPEIDS